VKLLLDECIDRRLAQEIKGHEVVTVPQAGWAGLENGDLLRLAQDSHGIGTPSVLCRQIWRSHIRTPRVRKAFQKNVET
jgi:hypothetical protein